MPFAFEQCTQRDVLVYAHDRVAIRKIRDLAAGPNCVIRLYAQERSVDQAFDAQSAFANPRHLIGRGIDKDNRMAGAMQIGADGLPHRPCAPNDHRRCHGQPVSCS